MRYWSWSAARDVAAVIFWIACALCIGMIAWLLSSASIVFAALAFSTGAWLAYLFERRRRAHPVYRLRRIARDIWREFEEKQ